MTPICLYVCGRPKLGKSHLVIYVCNAINARFFNVNNHTFCTTVTTEHWDGYSRQPIVVFDDHYKMNDGKQILDATTVFQVVSCTMFQPPFASLHLKGMLFDSSFVIITSNVGFPTTCFHPAALHRRHKHHVIVVPNGDAWSHDFKHLNFYYGKEIIDPYAGMYQSPFTSRNDVPYDLVQWQSFPFKHMYQLVSLDTIIQILCDDYVLESKFFVDFNEHCRRLGLNNS